MFPTQCDDAIFKVYDSTNPMKHSTLTVFLISTFSLLLAGEVFAHNVSQSDAELISANSGQQLILYIWLGAKHMVSGYDHLLFLLGVIFYLRDLRTIAIFVSLFALGHSLTLIASVLLHLDVNPYLVDAIIGLSVAYKGFDSLGGFDKVFSQSPNEKIAVLIFGLFHGLGLATKLQELGLQNEGLLVNLMSFNIGVELGQLCALVAIVFLLRKLFQPVRDSVSGYVVNVFLLVAGFALMTYQLTLYSGT